MDNKDLFGRLLEDSFAKDIEGTLAVCPDAPFSRSHQRIMRNIMEYKRRFNISKRVIIAIIAAAIIIFTGCVIFPGEAYYDDFKIKYDGEFVELYLTEPIYYEKEFVYTAYVPTYIPEGFEITYNSYTNAGTFIVYENGERKICFLQDLDAGIKHFGHTFAFDKKIYIGDKKVYRFTQEDISYYIYIYEKYIFTIRFNYDAPLEELTHIMENVKIREIQ